MSPLNLLKLLNQAVQDVSENFSKRLDLNSEIFLKLSSLKCYFSDSRELSFLMSSVIARRVMV